MSYKSSCHVCHHRSISANPCQRKLPPAYTPHLWTWCSRSSTAIMPQVKQTACARGAKAPNCHAWSFEHVPQTGVSGQRPQHLSVACTAAAHEGPKRRPRPRPPETAASRQRPRKAWKATLHNRNAQGLAIFCKFECFCHGANLSTGLTPMVDNAAYESCSVAQFCGGQHLIHRQRPVFF